MSKRSRKRPKRSFSQTIILILSGLIAFSMMLSLIIVALQPPTAVATPTLWPTWTPLPSRTAGPTPTIEDSPTSPAVQPPTLEPTLPVAGPELATATPIITATVTITPSSALP